jgi:hypothetical protein
MDFITKIKGWRDEFGPTIVGYALASAVGGAFLALAIVVSGYIVDPMDLPNGHKNPDPPGGILGFFAMTWLGIACVAAPPFGVGLALARQRKSYGPWFYMFGGALTPAVLLFVGMWTHYPGHSGESMIAAVMFGVVPSFPGAFAGWVYWATARDCPPISTWRLEAAANKISAA